MGFILTLLVILLCWDLITVILGMAGGLILAILHLIQGKEVADGTNDSVSEL